MGDYGGKMREIIQWVREDWRWVVVTLLRVYAFAVLMGILSMVPSPARADDWPLAAEKWTGISGCTAARAELVDDRAVAEAAFFDGFNGVGCPSPTGGFDGGTQVGTGSTNTSPATWKEYRHSSVVTSALYKMAVCPVGAVVDFSAPDMPRCANAMCGTNAGKIFDFDFAFNGTSKIPEGGNFCQEGCKAVIIQGSADVIELVLSGYTRVFQRGTARIENSACTAGSQQGVRSSAFRANESAPNAQGNPSTGVSGGPGQNDGSNPNTARIATNTDKIVKLLQAGATTGGGGGGGGGTAPNATESSGCGRPGQPPCAIEATEYDSASDHLAATTTQTGSVGSMSATMDATKDALKMSNAPTFTDSGGGGRWLLNLVPFFESSASPECKLTANVTFIGSTVEAGYDFCGIASWVSQILYWVVGVFTVVAIWNTVYGVRD